MTKILSILLIIVIAAFFFLKPSYGESIFDMRCRSVGGIPVQGTNGKPVCIKREALIQLN